MVLVAVSRKGQNTDAKIRAAYGKSTGYIQVLSMFKEFLVGGWATPLKKYDFVNWDD